MSTLRNKYGVTPERWARMTPAERHKHYKRLSLKRLKKDPERLADYMEKRRLESRRHNELNREKSNARKRAWKRANREKQYAYTREFKSRRKAKQTINLNPDMVYRQIDAAVPRQWPRHMRDDVIASALLEILEGRVRLDQIGELIRRSTTAYNRQFDTFKTLSLDATVPGTDQTYLDRLADQAQFEPCHD